MQEIIDNLSLDQKIGQMFMGNICGGETLEIARKDIEKFHFGGLQFSGVFERLIRGGNYMDCGVCKNESLENVAKFLADIKRVAMELIGIPLIMGGDQEGGVESSTFRRRNVTLAPAQMGLGASNKIEDTYKIASIVALESKILGLDMIYGPCVDISNNPLNPEIGSRSFGADPELVAMHGEQVVRAYNDHGIISVAKHFPGRGHGCSDAHLKLESIDLPMGRLKSVELVPFIRAIAAGVDSIMLAHTIYPALGEDNLPASLSPRIIKFLREELGFEGVLIPDTLTMFAISENFDVPRACAMCLEAGADMIFMKVRDLYQPTVETIKDSIRAGRLTEERINRSLERILKLKHKKGLFNGAGYSPEQIKIGVGSHENTRGMAEIARRCVLSVKNDGILPLKVGNSEDILVVVPRDGCVILANDKGFSHDMLPVALQRFTNNLNYTVVDEMPTVLQSYETIGLAKNANTIIFCLYSAGMSPEQFELLNSILDIGKSVVVVLTGAPYMIGNLPDRVKAVVCTFGITPSTFQATAELIFGTLQPTAKLPINLSKDAFIS